MMKGRPLHLFSAFLRDENGASAAEYALILGIIAVFLIGGIIAVRDAIVQGLSTATNGFHNAGF